MSVYSDLKLPALPVDNSREMVDIFRRELLAEIENWSLTIKAMLDRGLDIDDNMDMRRVSVTSDGTPGTEFSVAHTLGKVPRGYIVAGQDKPGTLYDGTTANDKTTLYLRSDAATAVFRIVVF